MSHELDAELRGLFERMHANGATGSDCALVESATKELYALRQQLAVLPARTNLLMMSAAIASELTLRFEKLDDAKTQAHIALLAVQLALKLEELVPR